MGYQEKNGVVTVHAKLTDLGKKYLLTDNSKFNISQFSPFDDEVDYTYYLKLRYKPKWWVLSKNNCLSLLYFFHTFIESFKKIKLPELVSNHLLAFFG